MFTRSLIDLVHIFQCGTNTVPEAPSMWSVVMFSLLNCASLVLSFIAGSSANDSVLHGENGDLINPLLPEEIGIVLIKTWPLAITWVILSWIMPKSQSCKDLYSLRGVLRPTLKLAVLQDETETR